MARDNAGVARTQEDRRAHGDDQGSLQRLTTIRGVTRTRRRTTRSRSSGARFALLEKTDAGKRPVRLLGAGSTTESRPPRTKPPMTVEVLNCVGDESRHRTVGTVSRVRKEKPWSWARFSISLAVKDIETSRNFYEKFGFKTFGGDATQNWLILKNGDHIIGLFQGMFEKNILTFNRVGSERAEASLVLRRSRLQRKLKAQGVKFQQSRRSHDGAGQLHPRDPDGNPILVDQLSEPGATRIAT